MISKELSKISGALHYWELPSLWLYTVSHPDWSIISPSSSSMTSVIIPHTCKFGWTQFGRKGDRERLLSRRIFGANITTSDPSLALERADNSKFWSLSLTFSPCHNKRNHEVSFCTSKWNCGTKFPTAKFYGKAIIPSFSSARHRTLWS